MTYTALSVLAVFCLLGCSTASPAHPEENFAVHPKRCSFGGCSDLIGGSIKTLSNTDGASAPPGSQLKSCSSASVDIDGNNSGAITIISANGGNHVRVGGTNSGAITITASATQAKEQSVASSDDASQPRLKGCSFGSCTVIIDGTNSGAITVPADYDCTVTITGTNSGAITGARCVQRGVAVQAPSKESSSGPCSMNIQGDNSQAITLK
ncbi:uncharacterized protein LOC113207761 [Frankliniella occidentalis]|uniref:Uncharacterized protein LOC113207761 n=1 Tax=Frankliniella occidentalis TaxID=133901 RepID=A0A6J1SGV2_FRAOC|nr:uncharacterized protein LOC113207761 [Frankliniella occidentalis]